MDDCSAPTELERRTVSGCIVNCNKFFYTQEP